MNKTFLTQDNSGNPIILNCEKMIGQTERLSEKIKDIADVLIPAYTKTELNFISKEPELVKDDFMLHSLNSLLNQNKNKIDWELIEQKTKNILEQFFSTTNWVKYSGLQDINVFVLAIDQKTGQKLGVIQFLITSDFEPKSIKAALYGVIPSAENRGLEKILMSSAFKLFSDLKRIFLHTRSTNEYAIQSYESWGFTKFEGKLSNWTDLEYISCDSDILQKISRNFIVL